MTLLETSSCVILVSMLNCISKMRRGLQGQKTLRSEMVSQLPEKFIDKYFFCIHVWISLGHILHDAANKRAEGGSYISVLKKRQKMCTALWICLFSIFSFSRLNSRTYERRRYESSADIMLQHLYSVINLLQCLRHTPSNA